MPLKTLFLNPPSFDNFDGGAGSRWPATREIESYWYPVWLAYPAGMLEGSRLLDAPPHHISAEQTIEIAKAYEFLVLFTSTPGFPGDIGLAKAIKAANPEIKVAFVGPHVTVLPEKSLRDCPAIDFVFAKSSTMRWSITPRASRWTEIPGVSFLKDGEAVHNPDGRRCGSRLPAACHGHLQARSRCLTLQRSFLAASLCFALHDTRLSGAMYVLPVATNLKRASLAQALYR